GGAADIAVEALGARDHAVARRRRHRAVDDARLRLELARRALRRTQVAGVGLAVRRDHAAVAALVLRHADVVGADVGRRAIRLPVAAREFAAAVTGVAGADRDDDPDHAPEERGFDEL